MLIIGSRTHRSQLVRNLLNPPWQYTPSSYGFVSFIECHIETHIEDSFPVSSGFESLIEIHIEDIVTSGFVSLF